MNRWILAYKTFETLGYNNKIINGADLEECKIDKTLDNKHV